MRTGSLIPRLLDYDDMIWISGDYEDGDDEFHYDIYLRPWGLYWEDMEERWHIPTAIPTGICR